MLPNATAVVGSSVAVALLVVVLRSKSKYHGKRLPPGPPQAPIVGNALQISPGFPWETFAEWGRKYGGIVYASVLGTPFIIINDPDAASELLDKQAMYTSERPKYHMAALSGWGPILPLLPNNERFKATRRTFRTAVGPSALPQYAARQESGAALFADRLLKNADALIPEIRRAIGVNITRIAYGFQVAPNHDPLIELAEEALHIFSWTTLPNTWLVDEISFLKYLPSWLPGASFKRQAAKWRETVMRSVNIPFEKSKQGMEDGSVNPSVVTEGLLAVEQDSKKPISAEEEDILKWSTSAIYLGGTGTSVSILSTLFLALLHYPDVQTKAQAEIDTVIGTERLPSLADKDQLPYVYSILLECLRWEPSTPIVVPHVSDRDLELRGMFIPKGSMILSNSWGILQDENRYPEPRKFIPERFMGPSPQHNPMDYTFGHGRRICPGIDLAMQSLFILISTVLATLDISCSRNPDGSENVPVIEYLPGPMRHPKVFNCAVRPRYPNTIDLLEQKAAT